MSKNYNRTFDSISSDNVLFDFDLIIRRVKTSKVTSEEEFMVMVRKYFQTQYPHTSAEERMFMVASYLTSAMTYGKFVQTLDILGVTLKMNILDMENA